MPSDVHLANLASHSVFLVADRAVAEDVLERERGLVRTTPSPRAGTARECLGHGLAVALYLRPVLGAGWADGDRTGNGDSEPAPGPRAPSWQRCCF
ncbi:hypothetical protein SMICM304S_02928 [Streptomyces microflavus]